MISGRREKQKKPGGRGVLSKYVHRALQQLLSAGGLVHEGTTGRISVGTSCQKIPRVTVARCHNRALYTRTKTSPYVV